jgi:hypothetical protein
VPEAAVSAETPGAPVLCAAVPAASAGPGTTLGAGLGSEPGFALPCVQARNFANQTFGSVFDPRTTSAPTVSAICWSAITDENSETV